LVGDAPFRSKICAQSDPPPSEIADFGRFPHITDNNNESITTIFTNHDDKYMIDASNNINEVIAYTAAVYAMSDIAYTAAVSLTLA